MSGKIEACGAEIATCLAALKSVRLTAVRESAVDSRKLGLKVRNVFKERPLTPQLFPSTLVSWLDAQVFHLTLDDDTIDIHPHAGVTTITASDDKEDWSTIMLGKRLKARTEQTLAFLFVMNFAAGSSMCAS